MVEPPSAGTVLVVDDEEHIRAVLTAYLVKDGFTVVEAATGKEALAAAERDQTDVVLLDIGLPDMTGLDVLATLRARSDVPVLLVTARAEEVDKLVGLSVGADDYITKPFSPREVVARVRTVLRRAARQAAGKPSAPETLDFGDLRINPQGREVTHAGEQVTLSALEFDLLLALASAPGQVFSRAQLLERVWGYDFYGDERVVDVHIRSMRALLHDDAAHPSVIGTVRGVGYKFLPRRS